MAILVAYVQRELYICCSALKYKVNTSLIGLLMQLAQGTQKDCRLP
jgi:hypothetical protein